jgi:hypothetical protein
MTDLNTTREALRALIDDIARTEARRQLGHKLRRAIEAEAVAAERQRIGDGVRGMDPAMLDLGGLAAMSVPGLINRAAVLALIEGETA